MRSRIVPWLAALAAAGIALAGSNAYWSRHGCVFVGTGNSTLPDCAGAMPYLMTLVWWLSIAALGVAAIGLLVSLVSLALVRAQAPPG